MRCLYENEGGYCIEGIKCVKPCEFYTVKIKQIYCIYLQKEQLWRNYEK